MIPLKQRNLHRPDEGVWGDCHRAAIASVLELTLDDVPHFGDGGPTGDEFQQRVRIWLKSQGLVQINVPYNVTLPEILRGQKALNPGVYYLLGGLSSTGVCHTVVCLDDQIVHDPAINNSGIVAPCQPDECFWVSFIGKALCP